MSDLTIMLIGGAIGALAGIASAYFVLMPLMRKNAPNAPGPIPPARREMIVRLIGASEVIIFAGLGAYIAYSIFGGAA